MKRSLKLTMVLYIVAVALYWGALYLYVPTLPTYAKSKTDDFDVVGLVLSMYGLWQAVVRLPLGIVADWLGRRKVFIIAGFALTALGAWVMGTANGIVGIGVGRAITGWAAATWVPLIALYSTLFPPEEAVRASTTLTLVSSVSRVLATSVTGLLNGWGGYSLAFFLAAGAAALAILVVLPIHEQVREPNRPSLKRVGVLITRQDVLLPAVLSAINQYAHWGTTFSFIPLLADQLGASDVFKSMMTSVNLLVFTLGNLLARMIVEHIGARRMVQIEFVLLFAGIIGAALTPNLSLLFAAQLLIGLSQGIGYPILLGMSIRYVEDAQRTTAMGLHQSVYAIGMFAGPWACGKLADLVGIRPTFGITAGAVLVVGLIISRFLAHNDTIP
ncbi:MAG: MFS transporter [Anaerolineae bacterium]|nr:MFS transporter [Anaerolineae bacterium]